MTEVSRRNYVKYAGAGIVVIAVAGVGYYGYSQMQPKKEVKVDVLLPKHQMDRVGFWDDHARKFEEQTGYTVNLTRISPWDAMADKVLASLGAESDEWDVIEMDGMWNSKYGVLGWSKPLNNLPGADEFLAGNVPALLKKASYNGQLLGIAWYNDSRIMFYNADHLDRAGYNKPPATWDEFVTVCQDIQAKGICEWPMNGAWTASAEGFTEFEFYMYSFALKPDLEHPETWFWYDEEGKPKINQPGSGGPEGLQFLYDCLYKYEIADPACTTFTDWEITSNLFFNGESSFVYIGSGDVWAYGNDPEKSNIVGNIAAAERAPSAPGIPGWEALLPEFMNISAFSPEPDEAWEYIKYMGSKEVVKAQSIALGTLPIWSEQFNDPDILEANPWFKAMAEQAKYLVGHIDIINVDNFFMALMTEPAKALIKEKTVEQALDDMADQMAGLLTPEEMPT